MHPDLGHVYELLVTHLEGNTPGHPVGDNEKPEGVTAPYLVLTPISPFQISGDSQNINAQVWVEVQVTAVGVTRQQAGSALDKSRDRMLDVVPDVSASGYKVAGPGKLVPGPGARVDDAEKPALHYAIESYRYQLVGA